MFSTYVEMILRFLIESLLFVSVLHVCGDDPFGGIQSKASLKCSPRMWRLSLYL